MKKPKPKVKSSCRKCGREFTLYRLWQVYCSKACRQNAWYAQRNSMTSEEKLVKAVDKMLVKAVKQHITKVDERLVTLAEPKL